MFIFLYYNVSRLIDCDFVLARIHQKFARFGDFFSVMKLSPAWYARACAQGRRFCQLYNKKRYVRTNATHIIVGSAPASVCPGEIDQSIMNIEPSIPQAMQRFCGCAPNKNQLIKITWKSVIGDSNIEDKIITCYKVMRNLTIRRNKG